MCRHYVRAVAGRLGYCALDRTRAVLQGDEIRACWQAPVRAEPLEGLFRDLTPGSAVGRVHDLSDAHAATRAARPDDAPGTRTWVLAVAGGAAVGVTTSVAGLREATHVPARRVARRRPGAADAPGSLDPEGPGVGEHSVVRKGDPGGDQALTHHGVLGDPEV